MDIEARLQQATHKAIEDAHRPNAGAGRPEWADNWLFFGLARHLASVPGAERLDADCLEPYVLAFWHACEDLGPPAWDDCWEQFLDLWDHGKARMPIGDIVQVAAERAKRTPDRPQWAQLGTPRLRYLARVCWELARMRDDSGRFYLSQTDAGKVIGSDQRTAGRMMHRLCRERVIIETDRPPRGTLKAIRYRFL